MLKQIIDGTGETVEVKKIREIIDPNNKFQTDITESVHFQHFDNQDNGRDCWLKGKDLLELYGDNYGCEFWYETCYDDSDPCPSYNSFFIVFIEDDEFFNRETGKVEKINGSHK